MLYWRNYPGVHAPNEPWTANRQAIRQALAQLPQDEFDLLYNTCFNSRPQYHVERASDLGEYVIRCLGGYITVTEQYADAVLLDECNESAAALQAVSPTKSRARLSLTDVMRMAKEQAPAALRRPVAFPPTPGGKAAATRVQARAPPRAAPPASANPGAPGNEPRAADSTNAALALKLAASKRSSTPSQAQNRKASSRCRRRLTLSSPPCSQK